MFYKNTRKRFGQHFLDDIGVLENIVEAIGPAEHDHLVEIGPGHGVLTEALIDRCGTLDVIEIDRDLVKILQEKFRDHTNITIHQADVLQFDFQQLMTTNKPLRVVGNLPYNISSPLLFKLFSISECIQDMNFMLQKEVALRLTAKTGDSDYSRLSVMAHYFCENVLLFIVPPTAFNPPPRVESAFICLTPHKNKKSRANDLHLFSQIVKEAFTYRRKTLGNALKRLITPEKLREIGIDPMLRPQQLTVENFVKISNIMESDS